MRSIVIAARYFAALIAATLASFGVFFLIAAVGAAISHFLLYSGLERVYLTISISAVGFIGVFVATIVSPRSTRHISSWIFTLLGGAFYSWIWYSTVAGLQRSEEAPPPVLPFLPWLIAGGGLCSLIFVFRRKVEHADAGNFRPSGTSGTSDAGASVPPESSGDS